MSSLFVPNKTLVIHNPSSGSRVNQRRGQTLVSLLQEKNYQIAHTEYRGHATKLAFAATEEGKESVIVIGGDGTLYEALQGMPSSLALAYFPGGSVNLFALNYKIPRDPHDWISMLDSGDVKPFYFGLANGHPFGAIASMGIDAYAVAHLNNRLKRIIGVAAYGVELFFDFFKYHQPKVSVSIDGKSYQENVLGVLIGRGSHYGGKYKVLSECKADEPRLSFAILTGKSKGNYLRYGWGMLRETMSTQKGIVSGFAEEIKIETSFKTPAQVDGDYFGMTPITFSVEQKPRMVLM